MCAFRAVEFYRHNEQEDLCKCSTDVIRSKKTENNGTKVRQAILVKFSSCGQEEELSNA